MPFLPFRRTAALWLFVAVMGLGTGCGDAITELTVQLLEQDGSGQAGTAELTAVGGRTEILLKVNAGPSADDPQPVHIHFGSCGPNLGSIAHSLEDVVDGESRTTVDAPLASLTDGNHTINLHKSYPEARIYTSCGDVRDS